MKKNIHPEFHIATYTDISSGKKFLIGSTIKEISVEISSASHPFYTGEARIIDIENRVDSYTKKQKAAASMQVSNANKKAKIAERRKGKVSKVKAGQVLTLRDMLKNVA